MRTPVLFLMIILMLAAAPCRSQDTDSLVDNKAKLPARFFTTIQNKYSAFDRRLSKKTNKYLTKLQRQEKKLRNRLYNFNGIQMENTDSVYSEFRRELADQQKRIKEGASKIDLTEYDSYIDTLSTTLEFLKRGEALNDQIKMPTDVLNRLKSQLNESGKINEFIAQRKGQLKNVLSGYIKLPASLQREYTKLNHTIYYYRAQMQEYRDMLKEPAKMERKALSLINNMPAFQKFMKENSQLASLFGLSEDYGTPVSLIGLQTRGSVNEMIRKRITAGGTDASAIVKKSLQEAQFKLDDLKGNLINELVVCKGAMDSTLVFMPNSQKTNTLLRRFEFGINIGFEKSNGILPSSSNLALLMGYKLNDKGTIGVGVSYKIGLGTIQYINFSSQAIGFRGYFDWKAGFGFSKLARFSKLYLSGGYELNYNAGFRKISQLRNLDFWQRSALIGLSKKVGNISKPFSRSGKGDASIQIFYDLLYRLYTPFSTPIVCRFGYKF